MKQKLLILITFLMMIPVAAPAQNKPTQRERESWMKQMQQYKIEYLSRKLELNEEQKARFAAVYKNMDDEERRVNEEAMKMERDVRKKGDQATDLEREKAAEAQFELKGKESAIEMKYFKEFKTILDSRQLLKLKKVERDFSKELMNKHHEKSAGNGKASGNHTRGSKSSN